MANPEDESESKSLHLVFDRRLKLEFRSSRVTPEARLFTDRKLDDVFGLTSMVSDKAVDGCTGKNGPHAKMGLLRQSVFVRLGGYEDVNDAEGLFFRHDNCLILTEKKTAALC